MLGSRATVRCHVVCKSAWCVYTTQIDLRIVTRVSIKLYVRTCSSEGIDGTSVVAGLEKLTGCHVM